MQPSTKTQVKQTNKDAVLPARMTLPDKSGSLDNFKREIHSGTKCEEEEVKIAGPIKFEEGGFD